MTVEPVQVIGLKQLQRDLRDLDAKLPRELRKVNLSVAQMVVEKAQSAAGGVSRQASAAAASGLKAAAEQRSAAVILRVVRGFELGAEFGALQWHQFMPWKGNSGDAGYFMYPTIRAENEHIVEAYVQRLTELLNKVYPD